ncbi:heparinase II/III domain-containing protein [Marininema halotolerans]|uniref:Heparinase II/III-like protein n=1 Tax=Marininema halotolerans TaxID=1155944 RepID=A0A1I6UK39_9BACL|nr:heparinase II/III family protein [Marininema halotolerans]SFT01825.1 Heparinase II/III-like protein [Marininema halotolerans]
MNIWILRLLLLTIPGLTFLPTFPTSTAVVATKTRATYYTPTKIAHARHNIKRYKWAQRIRDNAVHEANHYLGWGFEKLWTTITPQTLPRSYAVNMEKGSPITGKKLNDRYGYRGWIAESDQDPWKLKDPSSGYRFPTNDFASYYISGLDEHGIFDRKRANPHFLKNELYPEKGEKWGVDDGRGWVDEHGDRWTFIAYYNHWHIWHGGMIDTALRAFRDAYLYTGDDQYADAGIILLDRIADVYPAMNLADYDSSLYLNASGGTGQGKIRGSIWEATAVTEYVAAYDAFFPHMNSPRVKHFLSKKAKQYHLKNPKNSGAQICKNIEDGLVRQIFLGIQKAQIRGNFGMHQRALAMAAVVLDDPITSKTWIDWIFKAGSFSPWPWPHITGGDVYPTLMNRVDHDGFGDEPSTQYNSYWLTQITSIAEILEGYDRYPEADLYQHLKFKKMHDTRWPFILQHHTPAIGDSFKTGNPVLLGSAEEYVKAFAKYHQPLYAQAAHYLNGNSLDGLHGDIFSGKPDETMRQIRHTIMTQGPFHPKSVQLSGFGFTALRSGKESGSTTGTQLPFSHLPITKKSAEIIHHQGALYLRNDSLAKHIPEAFHIPENYFDDSEGVQMPAEHPGAQITFSFSVPKTGNQYLTLSLLHATNQGVFDIRLDGKSIRQMDFYRSDSQVITLPLGSFALTKGHHSLTFHNIGKNPSASGFGLGLDCLTIQDQASSYSFPQHKHQVWMYYGENAIHRHGHRDTLNIGIHDSGLDLSPDLGYPLNLKNRTEWVANTISHNTVMVNQQPQTQQTHGITHHFDGKPPIQLIDVDVPKAYPQTKRYRRTLAMVDIDPTHSYLIDWFRVKGGHRHHYSFHGAEGRVTTGGLHLQPQHTGSYAGADIPYGHKENNQPSGWSYKGSGFHYLDRVARDPKPRSPYFIDWQIKDTWHILPKKEDHHLRLTMLTPVHEVALANGYPPHLPGNPNHLRYLIAQRCGDPLTSQFVSVIEPYTNHRQIEHIRPLTIRKNGKPIQHSSVTFALQIQLRNGRIDTLFNSLDAHSIYQVGPFTFRGFFGYVSTKNGQPIYAYMNDGTILQWQHKNLLHLPHAAIQGTVLDFTHSLAGANELIVKTRHPIQHPSSLIGQWIYINNHTKSNTTYRIHGVNVLHPNQYSLNIGDNTLIHKYEDPADFSKGYHYAIQPGATWRIPLQKEGSSIAPISISAPFFPYWTNNKKATE